MYVKCFHCNKIQILYDEKKQVCCQCGRPFIEEYHTGTNTTPKPTKKRKRFLTKEARYFLLFAAILAILMWVGGKILEKKISGDTPKTTTSTHKMIELKSLREPTPTPSVIIRRH